jgi:fucose permease
MNAAARLDRGDIRLITIAYFGFATLGVTNALTGVAWPYTRAEFHLPLDALGILLIANTIGFFMTSFTSGRLIARMGVGLTLVIGAAMPVLGLLGYALAPSWPAMIAAGLVFGGSGWMNAAMNLYFATHYTPRLMNWLHAAFGVGAIISPLVMTAVLQMGQTWRTGYALAALLCALLLALFVHSRGEWRIFPAEQIGAGRRSTVRTTLLLPVLWFLLALFFLNAGLEATAGNWAYSLFTEARRVRADVAGLWVSAYWASFTFGRFCFGIVVNYVALRALVRLGIVGVMVGAALLWWSPVVEVGSAGLLLIGFSLAPIFPLLTSNTGARLGTEHAQHAVGFQVAASSIGIAALPGLAGVLAQNISLEILGPYILIAATLMLVFHELVQRFPLAATPNPLHPHAPSP